MFSKKMLEFCQNFANWQNLAKNLVLERCKGVHCVDLVESFQTHIYLQHSVSIQPRSGLVKFAPSSGTSGCIGPSLRQVTRTSARTTRAARRRATVERARSTVTRAEPMTQAGVDWCWYRQTLDGSFSAVSKTIFASKYSSESC